MQHCVSIGVGFPRTAILPVSCHCRTAVATPDLLGHFFLLFWGQDDFLVTLPQPQPPNQFTTMHCNALQCNQNAQKMHCLSHLEIQSLQLLARPRDRDQCYVVWLVVCREATVQYYSGVLQGGNYLNRQVTGLDKTRLVPARRAPVTSTTDRLTGRVQQCSISNLGHTTCHHQLAGISVSYQSAC